MPPTYFVTPTPGRCLYVEVLVHFELPKEVKKLPDFEQIELERKIVKCPYIRVADCTCKKPYFGVEFRVKAEDTLSWERVRQRVAKVDRVVWHYINGAQKRRIKRLAVEDSPDGLAIEQ